MRNKMEFTKEYQMQLEMSFSDEQMRKIKQMQKHRKKRKEEQRLIEEYNSRPTLVTMLISKKDNNCDECSICFEDCVITEMVWFDCDHGQCINCAKRLLNEVHCCALCRATVKRVCVKYTKNQGTKKEILNQTIARKLYHFCK